MINAPPLLLLNRSQPFWVLSAPGVQVDMNFCNNQYYGGSLFSLISLSRASAGLAQDTSGVWYSFAANVPRITNQGFLIEEARTNKCTNFNANPTDLTGIITSNIGSGVISVVDDTAALAAAGLSNIATSGKVYKLDNSGSASSSQIDFAGITGDTNAQSVSAYLRGSGSYQLRLSGQSGTSTSIPSVYTRITNPNGTPTSSTNLLRLFVTAGSTAYFILNQLEEGAFVTSPIATAGTSATRAADIPKLIGPALTAALNAKAALFQTYGVEGGLAPRLFDASTGNGGNAFYASATSVLFQNFSSNQATATTGASGTYAGTVKIALGMDASSLTVIANKGTQAITANAWTPGTAWIFGNNSAGTRPLNGYMRRFTLSTVKGAFDGLTSP